MNFELLLGGAGTLGTLRGTLPCQESLWGGFLEAFGRPWGAFAHPGTHSRHFLATMGSKVQPEERKTGGARPICIFGGSGEGKVRIFRTVNVDNIS